MKKNLLANISLNFLIRIISYIFSFITLLYITRTLLPEVYGRVSFVGTVAGFFIMFSALGMPIYGMRTCAENRNSRKDLSKVFNELLSLNILFAIIGLLLLFLSIFFVPALKENSSLLMIYAIGIVLQAMGCEWLFQGLEKFKFIALSIFFVKLISLVCILMFVHSGKDMLVYVFFSVISWYGCNIIYFLNLHKYVDFSYKLTIKKEHIKAVFIFFLMSCAVSVYNNLDIAMLGFMRNNYETGLYTIAVKGKIFLMMTGGIICTAALPRAAELWKTGQRSNFFELAKKALTLVFCIQLVVTVICFIFANKIILLIGGESYVGSVPCFRILLVSLIPIGLSNILGGQVLISCSMERQLLKAELVGALVDFSANLVLIPKYSCNGAAVATVLSEIIVLYLCIVYIRQNLNVDFGFKMLYQMPGYIKTYFLEYLIRKIKN